MDAGNAAKPPALAVLVDFHSHTRESDGTLEPRNLAALMRRRGVAIYSITDHDTLAAYGAADFAGQGDGAPRLVVGIEINTTYRGSEVHILGYGLPLDARELDDALATNRRARVERVAKIVERLNAFGIDLPLADVHAESNGSSIGRPHVAMALVRAGHTPTIDAAFRNLLGRDRPAYVPSVHLTPQRAIEIVVRAGGVPVLAHPGRLRDYDLIDELAGAGILGLEVFYPAHSPAQIALFRSRARDLGLVMTAGSDFHDARYNARGVGVEVDQDDIAPFLELVGQTA
jgi:predicted metal-dependent phosphoesterase TrpH